VNFQRNLQHNPRHSMKTPAKSTNGGRPPKAKVVGSTPTGCAKSPPKKRVKSQSADPDCSGNARTFRVAEQTSDATRTVRERPRRKSRRELPRDPVRILFEYDGRKVFMTVTAFGRTDKFDRPAPSTPTALHLAARSLLILSKNID
jgi:hypothetical protein